MTLFYQKVKTFLKTWPLFLLLLPVFFIYSGYNELFGFLSVKFLLSNFLFIVTGTLLVLAISFLLFRNGAKAAIFTFFFCLICLTFGYLHDSLKQLNVPPLFAKFTGILPTLVLVLFVLIIYLRKRKTGFAELYMFLNLLFVILIFLHIPKSV